MPSAITGNVLGPASSSSAGLVTTAAQTFAGKKTLDGGAAIKGDTSGSAVAAGYVGEKITWTTPPSSSSSAFSNTSYVDWTNANIVLTKGIWEIKAGIIVFTQTSASAGNFSQTFLALRDSSSAIVNNAEYNTFIQTPAAGTLQVQNLMSFATVVNVTASSETYKLSYKVAGNGNSRVYNESGNYSYFYGVRIA